MTNIEHFNDTVAILVKAYFDDTLRHGNCYGCAVGNIIAHKMGVNIIKTDNKGLMWDNGDPYPGYGSCNNPDGWGAVFCTSSNEEDEDEEDEDGMPIPDFTQEMNPNLLKGAALKQIQASGYHWTELAKIEYAFETVKCDDFTERMFKGLMAVVDVLASIHSIDLTTTESAKQLFIK